MKLGDVDDVAGAGATSVGSSRRPLAVLLTDAAPGVLEALPRNIELNRLGGSAEAHYAEAALLDWRAPQEL